MFKQITLFTSLFHALPDLPQISLHRHPTSIPGLHHLLSLWISALLPLLSPLWYFPALSFALSPLQSSAELLAALLLRFFRLPDISFSRVHLSGPWAHATHRLINYPSANTGSDEQEPNLDCVFSPDKSRFCMVEYPATDCYESFPKLMSLRFQLPH